MSLVTRGMGEPGILVTAGLGRFLLVVADNRGSGNPSTKGWEEERSKGIWGGIPSLHEFHVYVPESIDVQEVDLSVEGEPIQLEQEARESLQAELRRVMKEVYDQELAPTIIKAIKAEHAVTKRKAEKLMRDRIKKTIHARRAYEEQLAEELIVILLSI